jgi:hypothetical protein
MFFESVETSAGLHFNTSKAFARICHEVLILKPFFLNIPGKVIYLLATYLKYRAFYGTMNAADFTTHHISSGVPHGDVLGPTLFPIYIMAFQIGQTLSSAYLLMTPHSWPDVTAPHSPCRSLATYITPQVVVYKIESLH